jgi:integrase
MALEKTGDPGIYRTLTASGQTRYRVFWREDGKQMQRTAKTLQEARRMKAHGVTNDATGKTTAPLRGNTVEFMLEAFYAARKDDGAHPKTLGSYRIAIDKRLVPALGSRPAASVKRAEVLAMVKALKGGSKPSGWAAINAALDTLSAAYRWAIDQDPPLATFNPVERIERQPAPPKINRSLTDDELARLVKHLPNRRDRAIVLLLATTGMRPGELFGLKLEDIRPDGAHVIATQRDDGTLGPPKGGKPRVVDLNDAARANVEILRAGRSTGFLVNYQDAARNYRNWRMRQFDPARINAGLPDVRVYDMRHTYASQAIAEGASVLLVQRQLGHAKPSITLDTYSHEFAKRDNTLHEQMSKRQAAFVAR